MEDETYVLYAREYYIYFFSSGGGGGGGTGLSSSGRFGAVPSPTCSQGDRASKFLCREDEGSTPFVRFDIDSTRTGKLE